MSPMCECAHYHLAGNGMRYNAVGSVILIPIYFGDVAVLAVI